MHWTCWSYVYLRTDELTPEAAPPQQHWVLVLRPLPPPLQQRPLPPLLLPPLLLPLKPQRTPRFYGEPALVPRFHWSEGFSVQRELRQRQQREPRLRLRLGP